MTDAAPLAGRIALVTGATSGIGGAIARALVATGCRVIGTGRREDALAALANALGPSVHPVRLDMTDAQAIAALPSRLPEAFAAVDTLINNAGEDIGGRTRFETSTADELARVIETNLLGVLRLIRAFAPRMLEHGAGDIVNITSTNAERPMPGVAAYTASKAGVRGLTDVLRADYAKSGLRLIEIVPGLTRTGFAQARMRGDAGKAQAFYDQFPGTLAPYDVADSVVYAITRPRHVVVQQIVVTPAFQW